MNLNLKNQLTILSIFNRLKMSPICLLDSALTFFLVGTLILKIFKEFFFIEIKIIKKNELSDDTQKRLNTNIKNGKNPYSS